jgi:protein subunit release factor A
MGEFEKILLLSGKYDSANAIVEIHPGAGGTESQIGQKCCIVCTKDIVRRKILK